MTWNLTETAASQTASRWTLSTSPSEPAAGWIVCGDRMPNLHGVLAARSTIPMSPLHEAYCPEDELVVRYPQASEDEGVSVDIRYRLIQADADTCVLQATYAIQTRQFEAYPALQISIPGNADSEIASITSWQSGDWQLALIIEPTDVAQGKLDCSGDQTTVRWYGDFMERGVIHKCRLRLIVSNKAISPDLCDQQLQSLIDEPLPLIA